jgi:hypothetical protein
MNNVQVEGILGGTGWSDKLEWPGTARFVPDVDAMVFRYGFVVAGSGTGCAAALSAFSDFSGVVAILRCRTLS